MKTVALFAIAMIATAALSGCGSSSPAATADNPTQMTVTGLSTPKSVSVVTAN
jgi:hypothetical protein